MTDPISKTLPARPRGIGLREQRKPLDDEEKLEVGLEDSMDASDPPAVVAPGEHHYPGPLTGAEARKMNAQLRKRR
jgi:hypothetical protein